MPNRGHAASELNFYMPEFIRSSEVQLVLWLAALVGIIVLAVQFVRKWRDDDGNDTVGAGELLANFRDLHAQGVLSGEEYRTIKAKLAERLPNELNDSDQLV